jgi:hypothetical protein
MLRISAARRRQCSASSIILMLGPIRPAIPTKYSADAFYSAHPTKRARVPDEPFVSETALRNVFLLCRFGPELLIAPRDDLIDDTKLDCLIRG